MHQTPLSHVPFGYVRSTGCKTVANMIKGKSVEEIRKTFNIVNDFTPEEEEQIRKENGECFDGEIECFLLMNI